MSTVASAAPSRRLRVVHVITALNTGGAERQVELLADASRHDVRVIALYEGGVVAEDLRGRGVSVEVLGMAARASVVPRLVQAIRAHRPDVVHVHLLSAQLWGIPAARLARVPVIVSTEHSIMADTIEGRPKTARLRRLYRVLERLSTHTVAVSDQTAVRLHEWGVPPGPRMSVVNPPIDFDAFARPADARVDVRASWGVPDDAQVVAAIGRLEPVKRLDRLVAALAPSLGPRRQLVIIGDGALRGDLERRTQDLGVAAFVHLLGPQPDVPRLLSAVDVVVSPSRDETFGMAVVEALGAGLPVVYAEAPALDDLALPPGRAQRIARDSDEETERRDLAAAIDVALDAGRGAAPTELIEAYGTPATARRIDELYDGLVAQKR